MFDSDKALWVPMVSTIMKLASKNRIYCSTWNITDLTIVCLKILFLEEKQKTLGGGSSPQDHPYAACHLTNTLPQTIQACQSK